MIPLQRFVTYAPAVRMGGDGALVVSMTFLHQVRTLFLRGAELRADPGRRVLHVCVRHLASVLDREVPFDDVAGVDIEFSTRTPMFMFGTQDEAYDVVLRLRDHSDIVLFTLSGNQHVPAFARFLGRTDLAETSEPRVEANILRAILESVLAHDDYTDGEPT